MVPVYELVMVRRGPQNNPEKDHFVNFFLIFLHRLWLQVLGVLNGAETNFG
jgi:hypothetical protein